MNVKVARWEDGPGLVVAGGLVGEVLAQAEMEQGSGDGISRQRGSTRCCEGGIVAIVGWAEGVRGNNQVGEAVDGEDGRAGRDGDGH